MQSIVELPLETPFELGIIQIARVQIEIIGMNGDALIFELDDDLNTVALGTRREVQQGMFVQMQLREHAIEADMSGFWHHAILAEMKKTFTTDGARFTEMIATSLLVAQRFDGIEPRRLDGGQHAADDADEA